MADFLKHTLSKPIQLVDEVMKSAEQATSFMEDCYEIKSHTEKLAQILSQMMDQSFSVSYQRPVKRIIDETKQVLNNTLSLVLKCCSNRDRKRVLGKTFGADLRENSRQLQECLTNIIRLQSLLILLYVPAHDQKRLFESYRTQHLYDLLVGDFEKEKLWYIWFIIGILYNNDTDGPDKLFPLVHREDTCRRFLEEGGIEPLLKLLGMGSILQQKKVAKVIGILAYDSQSAEHIFEAGVCLEFVKLLKEGDMSVQAEVAWAISQLTENSSMVQDYFAKRLDIMRLLINHLAFETIEDPHAENVFVINKATSVRAFVMAKSLESTSNTNEDDTQNEIFLYSSTERESEEPRTKAYLKARVAKVLWHLAKGNPSVCRSISQSRALMCFVVLLEKGAFEDVKYYSAMTLMEITAIVEQDSDLRRSAFKPSSPTCKSLIDQLVKVIESETGARHLKPCIRGIGNLAKIFRVKTPRIFSSLLNSLLERSFENQEATLIALTKFAGTDNYLHIDHCKSIVSAGGAKHLVNLASSDEPTIQLLSLHLLCYIAIHVPDENGLVEAEVLDVLKWASKQSYLTRDDALKSLLSKVTVKLARAL